MTHERALPDDAQTVAQFQQVTGHSPTSIVRLSKRDLIPAVIHEDQTVRAQMVKQLDNPRYHELICKFGELTGVPLVLNTSFNDSEPIVCSPQDALKTFMKTGIHHLVLGSYLVSKA